MIDWSKTAFVFPGQASQLVGMGADLAQAYPEAKVVFQLADEILEFPLSELCWHGPAAQLNDTANTQPALYVTSIATMRVLNAAFDYPRPAYLAGHSLGEITALVAADALSFVDGLKLVCERGRLMKEAGQVNPGGMAAILGAQVPDVEQACAQASAETGTPVVIANDNCPGQIVISGKEEALEQATALLKGKARRIIRLAVSIAGHSPLLEEAAAHLRRVLEGIQFHPPAVPVIANISAAPLTDAASIRAELTAQLTSRVRWRASVQAMRAAEIDLFLEVGPKDVLTGLLRRIDRKAAGVPLGTAEAMQAFIDEHS
jgi:[acyl-carrier-protein] S-malonyltransferase